MKLVVLLSSLLVSSFSFAASCLGEAQVIGTVTRTEKIGFSDCRVFVGPHKFRHFAANMNCPLDESDISFEGVLVGLKSGHDCGLENGDELNGVVVRTSRGLELEGRSSSEIRMDLNGKNVSAKVVSSIRAEFKAKYSSLASSTSSLRLTTLDVQRQKIDQGYVDHIWQLTFQAIDFSGNSLGVLAANVTEGIEDRDGVLDISTDLKFTSK